MFSNKEHEDTFNTLIRRDKTENKDINRIAFFYILSSGSIRYKIEDVYNFELHEIKLSGIADVHDLMERTMLKLAFALFSGHNPLDINDIFYCLDRENKQIAINAIKLRFDI